MLSIQAVRGLPRLRAPGIVPCFNVDCVESFDYLTEVSACPFCQHSLRSVRLLYFVAT